MIQRTIYQTLLKSIEEKPVTLITGARQVGKSTLCQQLVKVKGYRYVSLDNLTNRQTAIADPELFLTLHPSPVIIDEVQYAPGLFDAIQSRVNDQKFHTQKNNGMYVLTGSQAYELMQGVTESMAGRVRIIRMTPLSQREALKVEDPVFDPKTILTKKPYTMSIRTLYSTIVRGFYPELIVNPNLDSNTFYSDYVDTYINRDVSQLINLSDKLKFMYFMEILASLTGQELVINTLSKTLGLNVKLINKWISLLVAGDIIFLLQPYEEHATFKRIVKRPKLYFRDTGLAAYLAKLTNPENLQASLYNGRFIETYMVNEIIKSYQNHGVKPFFYYYRDFDQKEIDLIVVNEGALQLCEIKAGIMYGAADVKGMDAIQERTSRPIQFRAIFALSSNVSAITKGTYIIPFTHL